MSERNGKTPVGTGTAEIPVVRNVGIPAGPATGESAAAPAPATACDLDPIGDLSAV